MAIPTTASTPNAPAPALSPRRFKIYFEDDALRERSEATARRLLMDAMTESDGNNNSARLAKKALKYRRVLKRMEGIDMTSPAFSASKVLGVDWCKTANLKAYCDAQQ